MSIWKKAATIERLNQNEHGTMSQHVGIEFVEIGPDFLRARMPVDERTIQPYGLLHGGASVVLAETIGSIASTLCVGDDQHCVGLDINANHLRGIRSGWVYGTARAVHVGARTHVWSIEIEDEAGKMTCIARLTVAVLAGPPVFAKK